MTRASAGCPALHPARVSVRIMVNGGVVPPFAAFVALLLNKRTTAASTGPATPIQVAVLHDGGEHDRLQRAACGGGTTGRCYSRL